MINQLTNILGEPPTVSYEIQGFKTGFKSIDYSIGGISSSDLVLIAAKAGNCSSMLLKNLGIGLSKRYHVLLINTNKNSYSVAKELQSVLLPSDEAQENTEDVMHELSHLADNIFIESDAHFVEDVDQATSTFRSEHGEDAIVLIDNLNGLFLSKEVRTYPRLQEEYEIICNLKMLTIKHGLPIVLLTLIKSNEPARGSDPPAISDLDHLFGLSCRFDKVIGVHRPEYYRIDLDEKGESNENLLLLHILRSETGRRDILRLKISDSNRFLLTEDE